MALGISSAKTSGISIPFLTGDPRSQSDAQKPANLTVRYYGIPHSRTQPVFSIYMSPKNFRSQYFSGVDLH
jgi:hypothetical protein